MADITVSYENLNLLIIILGLTIIIHLFTLKSVKKRTIKFANYEILERVMGRKIISRNFLPLILRILAFVLIVIAISEPTIIYSKKVPDVDFVLTIDTSSSMSMPDFEPNRLEASRQSSILLIDSVPKNTRMGLVSFAGKSYVKSELTDNFDNVKRSIQGLSFDTPAGTAIGDALVTSTGLLSKSNKTRVIVLITDGENNAGVKVNESIKYAKSRDIIVHTIGIGTENASVNLTEFEIPEELKDKGIAMEFPGINEEPLKHIARETGGWYFRVRNITSLSAALQEAVLKQKTTIIHPTEYILLIAVLLLIIEWSLGATKYKTIP